MDKHLDLLIIGAGPIGIACALEAQKSNLSYVVIEKGTIVNSIYHYPANMTFFSSSDKLEIDKIPFISSNTKPYKKEALEYYRRIATSNNLNIHLFEKVENIITKEANYEVVTNKNKYTAKNIILATGFYDIPNYLDVPGENLLKVYHYYNDPHYFTGQDVIVVGASNSSVDAALEISRKGGKVTMVIRGEQIGERVKYWVRPDIINRIEEGSIRALFNTKIAAIREDAVDVLSKNGEKRTIKNDFVLALTGYKPDFHFLEKLGVNLSKDAKKLPEYDKNTMETNKKGIYLAGVICGGMDTHKWFIENSRIHPKMIVTSILAKKL